MKVNELLNEGPMDYLRGAGREVASKVRNIAQPFKDIHQAGQNTSMESDIMKAVVQLANTIQKYRALKKQMAPVKEGVLDYMKGVGTELGNKASQAIQPFKDMHQAGKQRSNEGDLQRLEVLSKNQLSDLVRLLDKYGKDSYPIVKQAFQKYNIPPGIRAAVANKLKNLVKQQQQGNNSPQPEVESQPSQPEIDQDEYQSSPGIQARYQR
jgi:ribosome-associated translation inhibitor RaiA